MTSEPFLSYAKHSKSQFGQDIWIVEELGNLAGFSIELGARDGLCFGNSYLLEKVFQWNGICVEPNPFFWNSLAEHRNSMVSHAVVTDSTEPADFMFLQKGLSGIISDEITQALLTRSNHHSDQVKLIERARNQNVIETIEPTPLQ